MQNILSSLSHPGFDKLKIFLQKCLQKTSVEQGSLIAAKPRHGVKQVELLSDQADVEEEPVRVCHVDRNQNRFYLSQVNLLPIQLPRHFAKVKGVILVHDLKLCEEEGRQTKS